MKHHKHKKFYTKSDYVYIYSKLGIITGTFATEAMSLALFLGFVVTLIGHNHLDMSSLFSLVLFILSLPVVIRNVKRYKEIQDRLQGKCPGDTTEEIFCLLMLWCMLSFYDNIFLIMLIFLGAFLLPVFAVMLVYIRLVPAAEK